MSQEARAKRGYLTQEMFNVSKDHHSLGYYRKVAQTVHPTLIFEAMSEVKLAARQGVIRSSRGALFAPILKQKSKAAVKEGNLWRKT